MTLKIKNTTGGAGILRVRGTGGRMKVRIKPSDLLIDPVGLQLYLDAANPESYPGSGTTWYDLSGNGNNAAAYGSPAFTANNGGGFTFAGITDWFDTAPNLRESYVGTGLTVGVWANASGYFSLVHSMVERGNWGASNGYGLYVHFSNVLMGPRFNAAASAASIPTGANKYLVFTIDASGPGGTSGDTKVYINGIQNGATFSGVTVPTASGVSPLIARGFDSGLYFPWYGDIYEVHIYSRDLSASEVLSNYNATKTRYGL